ncbi:MAG: chitin deacetylase [Alphaproteobacteria bacterium]|nr:chitin deacetylase [Alphaproteobacteria bacterium]
MFMASTKLAAALTLVAALCWGAVVRPAYGAESAVIFMYQRIGEDAFPANSIPLDQFEAHLQELRSGGYKVLPVPHIIAALRESRPLPDRAIGITIDGAYHSVYAAAFPRLRRAGLPFTVFVATDSLDRTVANIMTWDQLREMQRAGVTVGGMTASHPHMVDLDATENRAELARARARFEVELGRTPEVFAYPYGEHGSAVRDLVAQAGFSAAFGQHSGVTHRRSDFFTLPRFTLTETYASIERFRLAANALPLPAQHITPADPVLRENPPAIGFSVDPDLGDLGQISCFVSQQGRTLIERLGNDRIEVRLNEPLPIGRSRMNCTMPGPDSRWRWLGIQFYVRR